MQDSAPTILLIEDDPDDADFILSVIKGHRPQTRIVHIDEGESALKFLFDEANDRPGLILLDLRMPRVDGIHILRRLRDDPERKFIPVVVLVSSLEAGRGYVESFGLEADGYLTKPVSLRQFLRAVEDAGITWY